MATPNEPTERRCPHCAELIKNEANLCRFCRQDVTVRLLVRHPKNTPSEREAHSMALQLMGAKKSFFVYQQLKQQLLNKDGMIAENISYAEAQALSAVLNKGVFAAAIEDQPTPVVAPAADTAEVDADAPTKRTKFAKAMLGMRIASLVLSVSMVAALFIWLKRTDNLAPAIAAWKQVLSMAAPTPVPVEEVSLPSSGKIDPSVLENSAPAKNIHTTIQDALVHATVTITDGMAVGSGFFITTSGYLLTNAHVVDAFRGQPYVILENGQKFAPRILRRAPGLDIALLKIEGNDFPTLAIGDATELSRGDTVWTIGAPHGLNFTLTKGIISFVGRNFNGIAYLQTDAAINGGNSGGPMINEQGEVVGINTFIVRDSVGLGFALPTNYLTMAPQPILQGIVETQTPNNLMRAWLAFEGGGGGGGGYSNNDGKKNPSFANSSDTPRSSMLDSLLKESKSLDDDFNRDMAAMQAKISELNTQKSAAEKRYQGKDQMTITQESLVGKELKEISGQVLNHELLLTQRAINYYEAKERNFKESLSYATENNIRNQIESGLSNLKQVLQQQRDNLKKKQVELADLNNKVY